VLGLTWSGVRVRVRPADQIDLVPLRWIGEVVVEDRLVRRRSRQPHRHRERAAGQAREHQRERPFVAPPRDARHRPQPARLREVTVAISMRRAVTLQRAVEAKGLPLAIRGVRSSAPRKPGEVVPPRDVQQALAATACITKQVPLGCRPDRIRDVLRQRLGHEPAQVRCGVEVAPRRLLERLARQAQPLTHRGRIVGALVGCRPVRAAASARITLDRAPDGVCALEHRLDPCPLLRGTGVERKA
jgi:hypothetical protein